MNLRNPELEQPQSESERAKDVIIRELQEELANKIILIETLNKQLAASDLRVANKDQQLVRAAKSLEQGDHKRALAILTIGHLEKKGNTDQLTGVLNRTGFLGAVETRRALLAKERRGPEGKKTDGVVIIVDIDYFKRINDSYGHLTGDEALKSSVKKLRGVFRDTDIIGRYGGEEFVIFCPAASVEEIYARLGGKAGISEAQISVSYQSGLEGEKVFTLSGGMVSLKPSEQLEGKLGEADDLLYSAKKSGRNKILRETPNPKEK